MKTYALISVSDKDGLGTVARAFVDKGMSLLATGNTYKKLQDDGFEVKEVSELTEEPERFGGRIKTLHHKILGGILFRPEQDEKEWPYDFRIGAVVCNFYPLDEKGTQETELAPLMEWVDIGGPTMVRAAAKNHEHVWVLTNVAQYSRFTAHMHGDDISIKQRFALEAFDLIAKTDNLVMKHFERIHIPQMGAGELRYGENPHQKASFTPAFRKGLKIYGDFSFNNWRDAEAAFKFVRPFINKAACVIKHQTICGACVENINAEVSENDIFNWAWEGDDKSRFGGVIGLNYMPTEELTKILEKKFLEVLVLPRDEKTEEWAEQIQVKKPKLKILLVAKSEWGEPSDYDRDSRTEVFEGALGRLVQDSDSPEWKAGGEISPESYFLEAAQWMGACSKSNAMAIVGIEDDAKWLCLAGAGQGQPNRVDALKLLALPRAKDFCKRTGFPWDQLICVSDGFLPFPDTIDVLAQNEIMKLVQPGGSKADKDVAEHAMKLNVEMVITNRRHFWH